LDNIDIFISNKDKTPASTNSIETYIKEQLATKIQRFIVANVQLMTDKIEIKRTKINLEANKVRLLEKKNSLVAKKKELRVKIAALNTVRSSKAPTRNQ